MSELLPSSSTIEESHFSYESLRKTTDIKKWINTALTITENDCSADKITSPSSVASSEQSVRHVLSSVETHSQQLTATLEAQISQSVTRLPRTTLELSRMISEAHELQQQMKLMEALASSSSSDSAYFSRLNELKKIQTRLHTCSTIISRAKEVDQRIKDLDNLQSIKLSGYDKRRLEDVSQLAKKLYDVKHGLCEIRKVEPEFGAHFNMALDEYEQLIQDALEEQCLVELFAHEDEKAADLFTSLYRIGRSSAVIERYNKHQTETIINRLCPENLSSRSSSLSVFTTHFITTICDVLSTEAHFWMRLSGRLGNILTSSSEKAPSDSSYSDFAFQAVKNLLEAVFLAASSSILAAVELASDCTEIISFLNRTHEVTLNWDDELSKPYVDKIEALLKKMIIDALSDYKVIQLFCAKNAKLLSDQLNSGKLKVSALGYEKIAIIFSVSEKVLCEACLTTLAFFPDSTVHESVSQWYEIMFRAISSMEVSKDADHPSLLESLTIFVKQVQPSIQSCKVSVENYISTRYSGSFEHSMMLQEKLNSSLWTRLTDHSEAYIQNCQQMVKNWILGPLIEKTTDYHTLPVWTISGEQSNATYDHHTSATMPVKELGEAIIEIPVTLESIRAIGVEAASNKVWMEEVIEDFYDSWLDDIVYSAVRDFVERKVLPLRLHSAASIRADTSPFVAAWEQLRSDIGYLRNVVAAVRDNGVEILEKVHDRLQRTPPPSSSNISVQGALFPSAP